MGEKKNLRGRKSEDEEKVWEKMKDCEEEKRKRELNGVR